tara:strand:+ start:72 stop:530 length:459 start_codon:yes stop_codon:yes gene_type:complete
LPRYNYTEKQIDTLYNSLDHEPNKTLKGILKLVNKHNIPLTNREEAADTLINLLHKNRVTTDLNDLTIVSKKFDWDKRTGKTTTAISDGTKGERGQLDEQLSEYAYITSTPIASRTSINKRYKPYLPSSNAKGNTKKKKPKKRKKRKSIRKK